MKERPVRMSDLGQRRDGRERPRLIVRCDRSDEPTTLIEELIEHRALDEPLIVDRRPHRPLAHRPREPPSGRQDRWMLDSANGQFSLLSHRPRRSLIAMLFDSVAAVRPALSKKPQSLVRSPLPKRLRAAPLKVDTRGVTKIHLGEPGHSGTGARP